jgi:4-hydroxy-3-polyprenylbenzoate decarboxylase
VVNRIVVLQIDKQRPADQMAEALFEIQQLDMVRVFVLFDRSVDILNNGLMLWKVFNNVSPDRDMVIKKGRMVIDACRKGPVDGHTREWPDELTFDI